MKWPASIFLFFLSSILIAQEVEVTQGEQTLYGTLLEADNDDMAALIIAGSGPTDRNGNGQGGYENNSLKMLAESLEKSGIASLRYDKRVSGRSLSPDFLEENLEFEDLVNDALAWIDFLIERGYESVVIIGHSQGSLVGMLAAQDHDAVVGFVSIAGAADRILDIVSLQLVSQAPVLKAPVQKIVDSLRMDEVPGKINPFLANVFRPTIFPFLQSYDRYDPVAEIRKLRIPLLIVNGTTDLQVGVDQAEKLSTEEGQIKIYEGMNHVLKNAPEDRMANLATYSDPDLPIREDLVLDIARFINNL